MTGCSGGPPPSAWRWPQPPARRSTERYQSPHLADAARSASRCPSVDIAPTRPTSLQSRAAPPGFASATIGLIEISLLVEAIAEKGAAERLLRPLAPAPPHPQALLDGDLPQQIGPVL